MQVSHFYSGTTKTSFEVLVAFAAKLATTLQLRVATPPTYTNVQAYSTLLPPPLVREEFS